MKKFDLALPSTRRRRLVIAFVAVSSTPAGSGAWSPARPPAASAGTHLLSSTGMTPNGGNLVPRAGWLLRRGDA